MRPVLLLTALVALAACQNRVVSTATNVGLAAATVASPTLAPVTAPVLAARMATPAPEPAVATTPTPPPIPVAATDPGLLPLLNQFRASEGLPPLTASRALNNAALAHAIDMTQNGFVSHTGSDGSSVGSRTRAAGCNWFSVAENITAGRTDPASALFDWVGSPVQRRTLVDDFTTFGEARVGDTWVAVFASGC